MELRGLREVILEEPEIADEDEAALAEDEAKNGEAYAELVQCLDNKSLSLVMRDAKRDGRRALEILREHYAGKDKPRVVSLYCELSSLHKASSETVTDYIIRAETIFTSLRRADEHISDGLQIAMVVKGLPDSYKPFVVHITQSNDIVTFSEFKTKLRSYESTEKYGKSDENVENDNVMKTSGATRSRGRGRRRNMDLADVECYACGKKGHMARTCPDEHQTRREERKWEPRRGSGFNRGRGRDHVKKADGETEAEPASFCFFKMSDCSTQRGNKKGLMVDCGATTHMINDATKFKTVDKSFRPEDHKIELADGTKVSGMAKMRGDAEVYLLDGEGRRVKTRLKQALYIPSFPQNIFSVKSATANGAEVHFKDGDNWLVHRDGTKFKMDVYGKTPNLSNMKIFGSECYVYKQDKKKLDSRCEKGIFVGYDKYSPAYNVYHPETGKVLKHRLVKFITKNNTDSQTQTDHDMDDTIESYGDTPPKIVNQNQGQPKESKESSIEETADAGPTQTGNTKRELGENRYPTRQRKAPEYLKEYQCKAECNGESENVDYFYRVTYGVPKTFREAMDSKKSTMWADAMKEEMDSLTENETFTLTPLPRGKRAVGGRWVYAMKESPDGSETCKARYVAKGYAQVEGIDYKETFSPTANMTSVRALMQVAVQEGLTLHQMDVKTAYLHAPMDCEVYMEQPDGFEIKSKTGGHLVCKLNKSLYGLKQSGRNWNMLLHDHLTENGFVQNDADHCVYNRESENEKVILLVWVDDLIIAASNNTLLSDVKEMLKRRFKMKDMGPLKHFLGIDFKQSEGEVKMTQKRHIEKMLVKFGMLECKPRSTPCEQKLDFDSEGEVIDSTGYREIVGSLIYIMTCTRPDLSWVVSKLSQHLAEPKQQHWAAAKHLLRYLKGTINQELHYQKSEKNLQLEGFSDADWAADINERRSTTGYCFSLTENGPVISWKSRKQPTVALSTCEAEYMALAATTQESMYLVQLLKGIDGNNQHVPVKIYEDNQGAIALSKNPVCRQRSKHIDIKYHFVRSAHAEGKISIGYCPTAHMVADVLTKPLTKARFEKFKWYLFGE
ncbi:Retrovirus-related Pol poly from transposon TNT 1-94 [Solea senegalensis]|uniref:Retrovirus-related Pol poly from transposon TNT 1-94 n=1 Tax=Solea senegalensis TaxID=28829 RepID=A0AAV6PZQ4_SOLSE|nr:Retrovirus-related Pol poly from transposon TNT 1-94 [Solea senegalensis]